MKLALGLLMVSATVSATMARAAWADAPGEVAPVVIVTPPAAPIVAPRPSVMANRWAVGFALGSESLKPSGSDDSAAQTQFAIGEIAVRYRATLHLEVELAVGGGREQLPNGGGQGDLQLSSYTLGARYRFRPERAWNWYLSGGSGQTAVASAEASKDAVKAAERTHVQLGVGVERRFAHFALSAELRAVGVVGGKDASSTQVMPATSTTSTSTPSSASTGQSGGVLLIGASYYF